MIEQVDLEISLRRFIHAMNCSMFVEAYYFIYCNINRISLRYYI